MGSRRRVSRIGIVTLAIVTAGSFTGAAEAGRSRCASAVVSETFVLPDGSEHAGGKLTLCDRSYNPVRSFLGRMLLVERVGAVDDPVGLERRAGASPSAPRRGGRLFRRP